MSFAYMPFYTGDYLRDTRGLSPMAHGVYLLLLFCQWDTRNPIPLDEQDAAGIANCRSQEEVECLRRILKRFFIKAEDGYYSRRMQLEIEKASALSAKRKYAGFKGYQALAKHLQGKSRARVPNTNTNTIPTPTPEPKIKTNMSGSPSANADAIRLLQFLNLKTGRQFRPTEATLKPIIARLKEYTYDECRAVIVRRWVAWRYDDKMREYLRPSTLFGPTNFAQYIGDVPTPEEMKAMETDE